ncbi:MAG TPA: SAM-dependent methyltransferase [Oceanospirillaceae bacterium]|nr:SAM-dependent methyltransferase [Oceanospirillaceae bacterium]
MADQQTLDVYNAKAAEYANLPESGVHHTIKRFAEHLTRGTKLLDLGCGHGVNSAYFRDLGFAVEAWDASTAMQKIAKQEFDIDVVLKTFDELQCSPTYGAICANYSLLHANPEQLPVYLTAIANALIPGGLLHLGMKLGTGTERDSIGRFYAYYAEQQLLDWLSERGLEIEFSHQSVFAGLAGNPKTGIAIHARKAPAP